MNTLSYRMFSGAIAVAVAMVMGVQVSAASTSASASISTSEDIKVINRQLEASIAADDWVTFPSSPLCEAFAYIQAAPSLNHDNDGDQDGIGDEKINSQRKFYHLWNRNFFAAIPNVVQEDKDFSYMDGMEYAIEAARLSLKKTIVSMNDENNDEEDDEMDWNMRMLEYSLATRAHAPLCEMHRTLAQGAGRGTNTGAAAPFVVLEGTNQWFDTVQALEEAEVKVKREMKMDQNHLGFGAKLLPGEEIQFMKDHDHDNHDKGEKVDAIAILYGDFGDPTFGKLYKDLESKQISFVTRYFGRFGTGTSIGTTLQGYGVRLDIRNVEYKSFDDKAATDSDSDSGDDNESNDHRSSSSIMEKLQTFTAEQWKEQFTNGIDPNVIVAHEQMKMKIGTGTSAASTSTTTGLEKFFANYLPHLKMTDFNHAQPTMLSKKSDDEDSDDGEATKGTSKVQKLSLQATMVISESHDPLWTMQQLSQNLPSYADALSSVPTSNDDIRRIRELYDLYALHDNSSDGAGMSMSSFMSDPGGKDGIFKFHVNGRRILVERPSFNLFSLIHTIREENALLDDLRDVFHDEKDVLIINELAKLLTMGKNGFDNLYTEESDDENDDDDDDYDDDDEDDGEVNAMMKMMGLDIEEPKIRIDVGTGYKGAVMYLNDIEKDESYRNWPRSIQQALMNMQFGGGFTVRRNALTALVVVDPMSSKSAADVAESLGVLLQLLQSGTPLRVGIVFATDDDIDSYRDHMFKEDNAEWTPPTTGACNYQGNDKDLLSCEVTTEMVMKLVQRVTRLYDKAIGFPYLYLLLNSLMDKGNIAVKDLVEIHSEAMMKMRAPVQDAKSIVVDAIKRAQISKPKGETYSKSIHFTIKKNIRPGMAFVNGIPLNVRDPQQMQRIIMEETQRLLGMAMVGKISDETPRSIYALLLKSAHKIMHPLLAEEDPEYRLLSEDEYEAAGKITEVTSGKVSKSPKVLFEMITNLNTQSGLSNLLSLLKSLAAIVVKMVDSNDAVERTAVAFRIIPTNEPSSKTTKLLSALNQDLDLKELIRIVDAEVESMGANSDQVLEDKKSSTIIMVNGRVFKPLPGGITVDDIELLTGMERKPAKVIEKRLTRHLSEDANTFSVVARSAAYLGEKFSSSKFASVERSEPLGMYQEMAEMKNISSKDNKALYFNWNSGENKSPKVKVTAVLDPLSDATQRAAPLLRIIRDSLNLPLEIILLPRLQIGEESSLPLTTYYRFVADPLSELKTKETLSASFEGLPSNQILTIRMDVPEPWDIQQSSVVQDTDNLRCNKNSCGDVAYAAALKGDSGDDKGVHASESNLTTVKYSLNNLLISGQCYDVSDQSPPNGLQITLSDASVSTYDDVASSLEVLPNGDVSETSINIPNQKRKPHSGTLVMKTVGYWQLRSGPGVWQLDIAKGTRGAEIYHMVEGEIDRGRVNIKSGIVPTNSRMLVIKDFVNSMEIVLVQKKDGYKDAELLVEETTSNASGDDTIHVFSLATGHLYERLLKIMMLSVTKRTSTKVKFWLFENFLSPSFKTSAYAMAKKIGCEVEFVTYKWPEWLRGQSEKQRIIWGYKILFLDVLFPLDLKKIIYVDADQVVRGDMKELWDLDLEGAPYGYTPMCESREETRGFRFWQNGFWPQHLRGKPYHISALYVVDLQRFRRGLVGDRLRAVYQQLSADPNNLSNLDQDLPNYTQHQIPIKSLPQDWLWCESWCSEESKRTAKTIDLCNNPQHKEPKVSMAKRIISGELFEESWVELDAEVEAYEKGTH